MSYENIQSFAKCSLTQEVYVCLTPSQQGKPQYPDHIKVIVHSTHLGLLRISLQEGLQCHPQILFHTPPQKKKKISKDVIPGKRGGQEIGPPRPIHLPPPNAVTFLLLCDGIP
jgi:hypothetical protein